MGGHITNNIQVIHEDQPVEEDEEEALSLCDLPLDLDAGTNPRNDPLQSLNHTRTRKSTPEAAFEFFEFHNDENGSDMCPADDIISGGILIPFAEKSSRKYHVLRKRSESLSELRCSTSTKNSTALLRISRSLDSQKKRIHRLDTKERVSSTKSSGQSEVSPKKVVKQRWYVFMFGSVKFPPEMELQDIKSRQFRLNQSVMFSDDGKKVTDNNRSSDKSSSWSLLKALSCRDYTSVAVTSSFYLPRA
ncbi:hypothetical protein like AT4G30230 [Hibiscus trionum]|uniref:Uncharacterized protein n=1 Tax=Hibiscus trionum TaxID=183268 RepID=A0A9W7MEY1_HIBTR|nr:hypothetical protein like AT4G30230 [Hibiscus trionum]